MSFGIAKAKKWWEKGLQPNMKEIESAQALVNSLLNAGNKLLVIDFFSPGCGCWKALHPKICQIAEQNPDVQFLQVNYEVHKSMCYTLNVHVLPFFRFYRGAQGRVCSFSCTNATKKALEAAMNDINSSFVKGSVTRLGSASGALVETFPSGCLMLDFALGGGLLKGRIVEAMVILP